MFNAFSALGGGVALATGTLGVPTVLLRHTPFDTFVVPGIFLGAVIGGSAAIGAIALLAPMKKSLFFSSAAGVIMIGWIGGETLLIEGFSWLQGLYLLTGLMVVAASTERFVGVAGKSLEAQRGASGQQDRHRDRHGSRSGSSGTPPTPA